MGIQGLLPLLKSIMTPIHIKDLEGSTVAIDTYSWLHKGALSCSKELCKGIPTSRHIDYCMHRVNLLRHYGVKPILVFDGGLLPMKIEQENKRGRARKENLARAIEHESNGNSSAAYDCYQKAVDISPSIAHKLIQVLKQENVCYIVAPYEADAQMTFLAVSKKVDAVITEDSDLIPFGCPRIIFKMDKFGQGVEFRSSMLHRNKDLSFAGFTKQMLLEMCILSGCDYLQSLPGMGLKRAHALIKKFTSYDKVIKHLKYSTVSVPSLYEESFHKAILTFQHQRVYDPVSQDIIYLYDISDDVGDDLEFLGPSLPQHIAKGIAEGDLDPFTKMAFQKELNISADRTSPPKNVSLGRTKKKLDLPVQNNLLTKYFCFASLEAKRKFRAPRMSPDSPCPIYDSSLSSEEIVSVDDAVCKPNCSQSSLLSSESMDNVPPRDSVEDGFGTDVPDSLESQIHDLVDMRRSPEHALLQHPRHSIHKPCITLHRERESKNVAETFEGGETRTENRKVIVRSSYFKDKSVNEDGPTIDMRQDAIPEPAHFGSSYSSGNVGKRKIAPSDNIQAENVKARQLSIRASDPTNGHYASGLNKTFADINEEEFGCLDTIEGSKTRMENRKVIVRSSYFKDKSVNENNQEDQQQTRFLKGDLAVDMHENAVQESTHFQNIYFNGKFVKRTSEGHSAQLENVKPKQLCTDASCPDNGHCASSSSLSETIGNTTEEGKFGSNISHLGRYSDIAEKSMERFVSVMSSFRFPSSGSRASGLRAPLKDVRNTCANRPTVDVDFSKFEYVPSNGKAPTASRKRSFRPV